MKKNKSCIFFCNGNGMIEKVLKNDFSFSEQDCEGKLLSSILHSGSQEKALDMILEAKNKNIASNYQLTIDYHNITESLYFFTIYFEKQLLIVGTQNNDEAVHFENNLQEINNEQTNQIRTLLKEKIGSNINETEKLFNELTSVNNELVNLQRELNKKNIELERLNKLKNQFLGMAAHDLRNPLSNINSIASFLDKRDENLTKVQKRFINHIKTQSSFMLKLVNELLDVSTIESGSIKINTSPTDIIELIRSNISLNKELTNQKHIKINFESNVDSLVMPIDKIKIDQVITNLLTNAVKFSNTDTEIFVKVIKKDDKVVIEIKDQGQGIAKNELNNLFKPFQGTSTKSTAGEKSTGLGLYIVKRIVVAHEGEIKVKSKLGSGSTFYFTLPLLS